MCSMHSLVASELVQLHMLVEQGIYVYVYYVMVNFMGVFRLANMYCFYENEELHLS